MRLLNTETFEVKEFLTTIPTFAILSHTWGDDEVSFHDIQDLTNAKKKAGWSKVWNACKYVQQYRFEWIWIDTCCIDKSSSAELSEALNSMYQYYRDGRVCIAYLSDVSREKNVEGLKQSRWFKRGWTLQELIAPNFMVFLDENWNMIGTRYSIRKVISEVTSIPVDVFEKGEIDHYSIAQKMAWASSRKTTRPEDMAYCLMGLFGVNMPPIYGEGEAKASMRLQQEIIKYSEDRSIFAWVTSKDYHRERGLFASSPLEFASSGDIGMSRSEGLGDNSAFSFGNNGLRIHLPLHHLPDFGEDIFLVSLHCQKTSEYIGIYLQRKGHRYIRWHPHFPLPHITDSSGQLQQVVVKESKIPRQRNERGNDELEVSIEFKLDGSQITLLGEVRDKNDANPCSVQSLSLRHFSPRSFRLRTKKGSEFNLGLTSHGTAHVFINVYDDGTRYDYRPYLEDSILSRVEDGNALVSCFLYLAGDALKTTLVELNYIPSSSAQFELYHQKDEFKSSPHALTRSSTDMNFMVYTKPTFSDLEYTHSAVSSNLICSEEGQKVYGTLSDLDKWHNKHFILAYRCKSSFIVNEFVFIALGLRTDSSEGDIPWIDVVVSPHTISIFDIWESYLPWGSRHGQRNKQNATAPLDSYFSLNLTVEKKTSGLVWYHVVMEEKYCRNLPGPSTLNQSKREGVWDAVH